jgi:hypothetical protein
MTDEDERTVVKTYVPRSQKEAWVEHAESLDMSQSEFLRTMVQAGRRGFDPDPAETPTSDATPGGQGLEERVRSALAESGVLDWDEVVARVAGDVERDVDEALGRLQERGAVRYSGRDGGYVLTDERRADRRDEGGDPGRPRIESEERRATGDSDGRRMGASGVTDPGPRRRATDPRRATEHERREVGGRSGNDGGPTPEESRSDRPREATGRSRRPQDDPPRGDGPRNESPRRSRREGRPAPGRREAGPRNGSRDGPPGDDARRHRRENDRRPRADRQRPVDDSRREDQRPPVESLREARESLDGSESRREDDESGDGRRTERVTDEERYDER